MRLLIPALTVCLLLLAAGSVTLTSDAQSLPAAPAPPAQPPAAAAVSSENDAAAARHAKRTACLEQARAKKLVGAQRTAYIKDCTATP